MLPRRRLRAPGGHHSLDTGDRDRAPTAAHRKDGAEQRLTYQSGGWHAREATTDHVSDFSVEAELVALDVLHHDARLLDAIGRQQPHASCAQPDQSGALGLECRQALVTHQPGAHSNVEVHPVFRDLALRDALEVQAWTYAGGVHAGERRALTLGRQRL